MTVWTPTDDGHAALASHDAFVNGAPHNTFRRLRDEDRCVVDSDCCGEVVDLVESFAPGEGFEGSGEVCLDEPEVGYSVPTPPAAPAVGQV